MKSRFSSETLFLYDWKVSGAHQSLCQKRRWKLYFEITPGEIYSSILDKIKKTRVTLYGHLKNMKTDHKKNTHSFQNRKTDEEMQTTNAD